MMEQNVSRSGRSHTEKRSDDSGRRHRRLEHIRFKPLVQEICCAHRHQLYLVVFVFCRQALKAAGDGQQIPQSSERKRGGIRRRHRKYRLDEPAHVNHRLAVLVVSLGVEAGVAGDFTPRSGMVIHPPQMVAVRHRRKCPVEGKNLHPVPRQIQFANDLRTQKGYDVRRNGEFEPRKDLFRHRRAAENMSALADEDLLARSRQVRGVDQAVMAAADYNNVVFRIHRCRYYTCHLLVLRAFALALRVMPIGTAFHERTFALCESLNYRDWSGYYTVSAYEPHQEHEYNAIRNSAALIDVSPLFKYRLTGRDATRLVNRIVTRDMNKISVGQVIYTPWCDEKGKVIDDGTVSRVGENIYRWTAADPNLRWFHQNARGLEVQIEDSSESLAALALQGPTSGALLKKVVADADITNLKYFHVTHGSIAGAAVDISLTGYTGDLRYEIWNPWNEGPKVWDALISAGRAFDIHAAGMLALDVARIEAGLLLIDVDFNSSKKALIEAQKYSPFELGLGRLLQLDKEHFVGRDALLEEKKQGHKREIVGLEVDWPAVERLYDEIGLAPSIPAAASRVAVPIYKNGIQIGKATSTTWSPTLKK